MDWAAAVHEEDRELAVQFYRDVADGLGTKEVEYRIVKPDGEVRHLKDSAFAIKDLDGKVIRIGGIIHDITEIKQTQELVLLTERLKAEAEMAGGVTHHFNNMLQIIVTSAQVALMDLDSDDSEGVRNHLGRIMESASFGAETVKRLESFVKLRPTDLEPAEIVDLSKIARQTIDMTEIWWRNEPEKNGISINMISRLSQGCWVSGRERELFEVIINLVKNAVEALPNGGEIQVETEIHDDAVILTVRDTGIGIAHENFGKLFEPFYTTKGLKRTGLGLAGSYGIIKNCGGTISVESVENQGSTFKVTLPYVREEKMEPEPADRVDEDMEYRILIIDDMEPLAMILEEGLRDYGQTVHTALSGTQGLHLFEKESLDVVICDLGMPGMSGWEVGKRIKEHCEKSGVPKTPFVMLTGWGGIHNEKEKLAEAGVDAVVQKPLDLSGLLETVKKVIAGVAS